MFNKPPYNFIAIEGNIGSGKTTLAKKIADEFSSKLMLEQFEDNPFLPDFYKTPERFAMHVELSFLAERYTHVKQTFQSLDLFNQLIISDYMFQKCSVFAKATLKPDEHDLFLKLYQIIVKVLPSPDLIIYLHSNVEKLQKQIEKRGRSYENAIPNSYLESIDKGYIQLFKSLRKTPILIVNTNNMDFVANQSDYEIFKNLLMLPHQKGIQYLNFDEIS